jgi:SsrA-binding protein
MKIINRNFHRDYSEIESYEVGIALTGSEVKSIRSNRLKLDDSYVRIMADGSAYLINADIPIYEFARSETYDARRTRKLLLHKRELTRLRVKMAAGGLTLAPKSCYNKGPLIKLEIALVKGRGNVEKKKLVKQRDEALDEKRMAKEYMKVER